MYGIWAFSSLRWRAENLHAYEQVDDIPMLAAVYAVAIAKNHPFIDGKKRAAFVGMVVFLGRNGLGLTASQVAASDVMLGVAAGEIDVDDLAAWIRDNTIAR